MTDRRLPALAILHRSAVLIGALRTSRLGSVLLVVMLAASLAAPAALGAPSDRDGDGLSDHFERTVSKTNPRKPDSDQDGLTDAFEVQWGTNPNKRDSDRDGIPDGQEDDDHDQLSARGEQRFGTDPTNPDSNGDGIIDGADDANGNGVRDALEQDRRTVPKRLRAQFTAAASDFVKNRNGCHTKSDSADIYVCIYGNTAGKTKVTLWGDSHALQWLPALEAAGKQRGWRITALTKSACPSVAVAYDGPTRRAAANCRAWRKNALAWLRKHPQDIVILTNSRRYDVVGGNGKLLDDAAKEKRWQRGLARTIRAIPKRSKVVVLSDTPHFTRDPQRCLARRSTLISDCETRRAVAISALHDTAERNAAEAQGARFADLNAVVCPYDPCPLFAANTMMWRDNHHLTAAYSRQLAPAMVSMLRKVLRGRPLPTDISPSQGLASETVVVSVTDSGFDPQVVKADGGSDLEVIFTNLGKRWQRIALLDAAGTDLSTQGPLAAPLRRGTSAEIILNPVAPGEYTFMSERDQKLQPGKLIVREPPTASPEPPTSSPESPTASPEPPTSSPELPTASLESPTASSEPPVDGPGAATAEGDGAS